MKKLNEDIVELDAKNERDKLFNQEVGDMKGRFEELWRLLKSKEEILIQRSRSKCFSEGDANSTYLHHCMKIKSSQNGSVQIPNDIKKAVVYYFWRPFRSSD